MHTTSLTSRTWRSLLELESHDLVSRRFHQIHGRTLPSRRAREITSAAAQGREFFVNAAQSNIIVKPLLLFYGIAGLSRALTLLLRKTSGEECLHQGHGLQTQGWLACLGTDLSSALKQVPLLTVTTCPGAFSDLLDATKNTSCLHTRSEAVGASVSYPPICHPVTLSLADILSRNPDLQHEHRQWTCEPPCFFYVHAPWQTDNDKRILSFDVTKQPDVDMKTRFPNYVITENDASLCHIEMGFQQADNDEPPVFVNSYINKAFGAIPLLFLTTPLKGNVRLSQLGMSYILSFILGMLARYFPTHWIALGRAEKGDSVWPAINGALDYLENAYPVLITELLSKRQKSAA